MTETNRPKQVIGQIVWTDLTVPNAGPIQDFYADVVGWEPVAHPMPASADGEEAYSDFVMQTAPGPGGGDAVAGVCYARGANAGIPPVWLVYVRVADLESSMAKAKERGGEVVYGPRTMGSGKLAVVRDPAGAMLGLWAD